MKSDDVVATLPMEVINFMKQVDTRTESASATGLGEFISNKKRNPDIVQAEKKAGLVHLAWMCKLYAKQAAVGRLFFHEHPGSATSWNEKVCP